MHNLDRLFLMPFHEIYLLGYLISYCEHPYQLAVTDPQAIKSFIVIIRLWMLMNCEILAKACNVLRTRLQIFVTWVSKPSLLFKLIHNSFLSLPFLMTSLSTWIEKSSSVLKMRWHLSFEFLKSTFPTSSRFSRVMLAFSEHTYGVLSSV